jgi:hypothetical protein
MLRSHPLASRLALLSVVLGAALLATRSSLADEPPPINPAMTYLHRGATLSLSWKVFSYPGQWTNLTPDANGDWVAADGTRLSASSRQGVSGSGVSQAEVIRLERDRAWLLTQSFTDMRLLGFADPLAQGRPVTIPAPTALCDLWIDPARLATLRSDGAAHTVVQPIRWTAGVRPVDAIRVIVLRPGHLLDHVFERTTGLCVHASSIDQGAAPQSPYYLSGDTHAGDTMMTYVDVLSVRDQHTPWADEPMPAWTSRFKVLHYTGSTGIVSPNPMIGGRMTPLQMDVTNTGSGDGWLSVDTNAWAIVRGQPTPPVKSHFQCGRDQFNTFAAGPAALAKLTAGQLLDEDPATHVRTAVAQADARHVTITQTSAGLDVSFTFDVGSGALVSTTRTDRQTRNVTTFQLASEE